MSSEQWFPFHDMNNDDIITVTEICGSPPLTKPENFESLFQYNARPMLSRSHFYVKQLLLSAADACTDVYDIDVAHGLALFRRGALLYTGILAELSHLETVPCEPEIFSNIANSNGHELIWAAYDRLGEDTPNFCSFIDQNIAALDIRSSVDYHLAIAGAGLIHIMTMGSLGIEDDRLLERDHPELADLETRFSQIENE